MDLVEQVAHLLKMFEIFNYGLLISSIFLKYFNYGLLISSIFFEIFQLWAAHLHFF